MAPHNRDRRLLYYALVHMIDPIAREVFRGGMVTTKPHEDTNIFVWREKFTYNEISLIVRENDWIVKVFKDSKTVGSYRFSEDEDVSFLPDWIQNLETDIICDLK